MVGLLGTLVIGLLAGMVARALKPGKNSMGLVLTCLLGIGGSFFAQFLGEKLGLYQPGDVAGFVASVIGAILLLSIIQFIKK